MVLDSLVHYYEDKVLDGCYICANSNLLLFEKEWRDRLIKTVSKTFEEVVKDS